MENIELLDIPERCCRNCKSFIRVRDTPSSDNATFYDKVVWRKGFCLLGQRYGNANGCDFSLYYNDHKPLCNSYILDEYNEETNKTETKFRDWNSKLLKNTFDRRSKEYKLLDQYRKSLDRPELIADNPKSIMGRPIKDESMSKALGRIMDDRLLEKVAELYITSIARTQLHELNCRKAMPYKEYDRVVGYVRFKLAEFYEKSLDTENID